jgi:hypothetical protein
MSRNIIFESLELWNHELIDIGTAAFFCCCKITLNISLKENIYFMFNILQFMPNILSLVGWVT